MKITPGENLWGHLFNEKTAAVCIKWTYETSWVTIFKIPRAKLLINWKLPVETQEMRTVHWMN